jgi:predicted metal-dependent hydrolase
MSEPRSLVYGTRQIAWTLLRRDRRTLEIAVSPEGAVEAIAPLDAPLAKIEQVLLKRMPWVDRQLRELRGLADAPMARQHLPGETHRYRGRAYRLKVERGIRSEVRLFRGRLVVFSHAPGDREETRRLVEDWYRRIAHRVFAERLEIASARFPDPEAVRPAAWRVRQMKKRWGSMTAAGRLTLNLDLIRMPTPAIDYVLTHELAHRIEHHHGAEFWRLLERVMPDWRDRKNVLEASER